MSAVGEAFIASIGRPELPTPSGLEFNNKAARRIWEALYREIGAGWFSNRFLYLFGPGLDAFLPCLDAWSFLVEPGHERMIIGRNAYGALLVAEDPTQMGLRCPLFVLDPLNVRYWTHPHLVLVNLIGNWLPRRRLPDFFDRRLYDAWVGVTGKFLELNEILAMSVPKPLGGKMAPDHFIVEDIVSYYSATGCIYARATQDRAEG
ncbi:MAG: hypothetical protein SVX38_07150 [Chloroflexota bacterium]|nr:hypothetical protein [Chloroflexota bacterium]